MPFRGNQNFHKKSRKFQIPSIWEQPLPCPNSVLAFGTGFFQACLRSGNIREFPSTSRMKINFNSYNLTFLFSFFKSIQSLKRIIRNNSLGSVQDILGWPLTCPTWLLATMLGVSWVSIFHHSLGCISC